jgi:hypothetical protein
MNSPKGQTQLRECLEKRRHPRMPCSAPIEYTARDRTFRNLSRDISTSGLFVETWDAFSVGETIAMALPLEKQEPIQLTGKVVRIDKQGIGIEFV